MEYNTYTTTQHTVEIDGIEFPTAHNVGEASTSMHAFNDDKTQCVVAYTVRDADCANPLEDCEGMGKLYLRGRYGNKDSGDSVRDALGLDRYGSEDFDLIPDEVLHAEFNSRLAASALSAPLDLCGILSLVRPDCDDYDALECGGGFAAQMCRELEEFACFDPDDWDKAMTLLGSTKTMHDVWIDCREAGLIGNRHAVLLDVYDHGGVHFSISHPGTGCMWDTSRGVGIWVPDQCAEEEIERRTPVYAKGVIVQTRMKQVGLGYAASVTHKGEILASTLTKTWHEAFQWLEAQHHPEPNLKLGRIRACHELAQDALDVYNSWCCGDCWGVVVETYCIDDVGQVVEYETNTDACWGFVGSEFAESELRCMFDHALKQFEKEAA